MRHAVIVAVCILPILGLPARAQQQPQRPAELPRVAVFDAAAIRRQAAQLAEFRALLSDPDVTVRLLTMQEAMRAGDASQRELAVEAGLASNESSMLEAALRGVFANVQQIIIEPVDTDGKPKRIKDLTTIKLVVTKFDPSTGHIEGTTDCYNDGWSGQIQGNVFSYNTKNSGCSGLLTWNSEAGEFRGRIDVRGYTADDNRSAVWRPR